MVFDEVLAKAAEKLVGDERLRGNLTDEEFAPILEWALAGLGQKLAKAKDKTGAQKMVEQELAPVLQAMKALNDLLPAGQMPTLAEAAQRLQLKLPKKKIEIKDRAGFIQEVLKLIAGDEAHSKK